MDACMIVYMGVPTYQKAYDCASACACASPLICLFVYYCIYSLRVPGRGKNATRGLKVRHAKNLAKKVLTRKTKTTNKRTCQSPSTTFTNTLNNVIIYTNEKNRRRTEIRV